mmetsp:Transcript_83586/g.183808  ORF Transcript_83586/g.183808 Transcript_83586/m.183808 type:complete len:227 (-) Transcript_83586:221-901(-)
MATDTASEDLIRALLAEDADMGGVQVIPRSDCPHLASHDIVIADKLKENPANFRCSTCGEDEVWYCLFCGVMLCSRYKNRHMVEHCEKESHCVALSFSDLSFWCFECSAYLNAFDITKLHGVFTAAHIGKFGEAPALPDPNKQGAASSSALFPQGFQLELHIEPLAGSSSSSSSAVAAPAAASAAAAASAPAAAAGAASSSSTAVKPSTSSILEESKSSPEDPEDK